MDADFIIGYVAGKLFGLFCHQDPSIMMQVEGKYILLCPRCLGMHVGFFISLIFFSVEKVKRVRFPGLIPAVIVTAGFCWLAIDWCLGQTSFYQATTISRLSSGLLAGVSFSVLYLIYYRNFVKRVRDTGSFSCRSIIGAIFLVSVGGWALLQSQSWRLVTLALIVLFLANAGFIVYAVFQRIRLFVKENVK